MILLTTKRRAVAVAATAVLALVLAACGTSSDKTATSDHNSQDVAFAQGMIPHHAQAVEMAKLASSRAASPEVKTLAAKIEAAQQPEIDAMGGWLSSWGEPTIDPGGSMGHSMHAGDGMMSSDDMATMEGMNGAAFDRMFLEGMIKHHEGAIKMAETEKAKGKFEPAKAMATAITTSQQAEIDQMKKLLS